jgi:hypothetical protein
MTTTIKIFRQKFKVPKYQALGTVQKQIISTRQNIDAIGKTYANRKEGVKRWEETSQNSRNNAEIIRELYKV